MKNKPISFRTCLITNKQNYKANLIRLVKNANQLEIDLNQNMKQRGFYISKDKKILQQPNFINILEKRTKAKVTSKLIEDLNTFLINKENGKEIN